MNKIRVIDFELKKYEKDLIDMVKFIGIDEFEQTDFEIPLTAEEKELLIKCTKITIDILEGLKSEKEMFEEAYFKQLEFLEILDDSNYYNSNLLLSPFQHECPLLSIEIGGRIDQDSKIDENNINYLWNDKEYKLLVEMYEKFLNRYRVIIKIISPFNIPEHLRD